MTQVLHVTLDFKIQFIIHLSILINISILNEIEWHFTNFGFKSQRFKTHIIHKAKTQVKINT